MLVEAMADAGLNVINAPGTAQIMGILRKLLPLTNPAGCHMPSGRAEKHLTVGIITPLKGLHKLLSDEEVGMSTRLGT